MDLGAYMQIADLEEVAKANGIEVPRLRGYRLMANEEQITEEQIQEIIPQNLEMPFTEKAMCKNAHCNRNLYLVLLSKRNGI